MKKILVYGDSNTWGDNFLTGIRIPDENQWPNLIQNKLGNKYRILQEGLPGRIAGNDEKVKTYKNGKDTFMAIFRTNAPVDVVVIALGTNDLQLKYDKSSKDIINDLLWYKKTIEELYNDLEDRKKFFIDEKMPTIKYLLPINFDYKVNANMIFDKNSEKKRQEIINYFKDNKIDSIILDNLELFDDGIHLNNNGHKQIADKIVQVIEND